MIARIDGPIKNARGRYERCFTNALFGVMVSWKATMWVTSVFISVVLNVSSEQDTQDLVTSVSGSRVLGCELCAQAVTTARQAKLLA